MDKPSIKTWFSGIANAADYGLAGGPGAMRTPPDFAADGRTVVGVVRNDGNYTLQTVAADEASPMLREMYLLTELEDPWGADFDSVWANYTRCDLRGDWRTAFAQFKCDHAGVFGCGIPMGPSGHEHEHEQAWFRRIYLAVARNRLLLSEECMCRTGYIARCGLAITVVAILAYEPPAGELTNYNALCNHVFHTLRDLMRTGE